MQKTRLHKQIFNLGACLYWILVSANIYAVDIFDMDAIRDASTLEVKVLQPWRTVPGLVSTRQLLITINVGQYGQARTIAYRFEW